MPTVMVQKEARPSQPTGGSAITNSVTDTVTLQWNKGSVPSGAKPDHYEVLVSDESGNTLYSAKTDDPEDSPPLADVSQVIPGASGHGLVGAHTAEVRHCNAAGGCSLSALAIEFTLEARYFDLTPEGLLALGETTSIGWDVPGNEDYVFVDAVFPEVASEKVEDAGDIRVEWIDADKMAHTLRIDQQSDRTAVSDVAGALLWIHAEEDAFYSGGGLIVLNFHSGRDNTGTLLAKATIQKEARPNPPVNRDWSTDTAAEVSLTITSAAALGLLTGSQAAQAYHYNQVGGCSTGLSIEFSTMVRISDLLSFIDVQSSDPFTVSMWDLVPLASYTITVSTDNANAGVDPTCSVTAGSSKSVQFAPAGTSLDQRFTLNGCSLGNATVTATLTGVGINATTSATVAVVTAVPTSLSGDNMASGQVTLTWDPVPLADGYDIQQFLDGGPDLGVVLDPAVHQIVFNGAKAVIDGLVNGSTYSFQVSSWHTSSRQFLRWSASESVPLLDQLSTPVIDIIPLPGRMARLEWDAVTNANISTEYKIEFRKREFKIISTDSQPVSVALGP